MISRFLGKLVKVWNRKIFDFVAFAKVNSSKNVQFFGLEVIYFWQKVLFSRKAYNYSIRFD